MRYLTLCLILCVQCTGNLLISLNYHLAMQNHWQNTLSSFYTFIDMYPNFHITLFVEATYTHDVLVRGSGHNRACCGTADVSPSSHGGILTRSWGLVVSTILRSDGNLTNEIQCKHNPWKISVRLSPIFDDN